MRSGRRHRRNKPSLGPRRKWVIASLAAAALLVGILVLVLAGSRRDILPTGQVVAAVAGEEVTTQDLQAEARAQGRTYVRGLGPNLAQTVVDRILLARQARDLGLLRAPDFPSDKRRADAQVLADQMLRRLPGPSMPSAAQIALYQSAHPEAFAERQRLTLNVIIYAGEAGVAIHEPVNLERLKADLQRKGVRWTQTATVVMSDELPAVLLKALRTASADAAVIWRTGPDTTAFEVSAIEPSPLSGLSANAVASSALLRVQRQDAVKRLLSELRARHTVRYQAGFAPSE